MWIETCKRPMAFLCSVLLFCTGLAASAAPVGVIGTQEMLAEQQLLEQRDELKALMDRADVKLQLEAMGVDPEWLEARIGAMTPAELAQVNEAIEQLPAGAGAGTLLGVVLVVFIVFVITDVLGATNIFPFINPVVN